MCNRPVAQFCIRWEQESRAQSLEVPGRAATAGLPNDDRLRLAASADLLFEQREALCRKRRGVVL